MEGPPGQRETGDLGLTQLVSPFSSERMSRMCCPPCPIQMTTFSFDGSEVREEGPGHRCVLDSRRMSSGIPGRPRRLAIPPGPSPSTGHRRASSGEGTWWVSCRQLALGCQHPFPLLSLLCRPKESQGPEEPWCVESWRQS